VDKLKKLFSRDDATIHDRDAMRLSDYCNQHGIEPDQIHQYPSFDIRFSDGSDWTFRCKGKIYHAVYSCGVYEDLYEVTEEQARTLLQTRLDKFFGG
jgi:uncharacterized protein YegJ (DUF2314 family)